MGTIVRKYPTENGLNSGAWSNKENLLNIEDDLCASKNTVTEGDYDCYVKTYGFTIPVDATIIRETIGIKGGYYLTGTGGGTGFWVNCGMSTWEVTCELEPSYPFACADIGVFRTQNLPSYDWISLADLNAENFTSWVRTTCAAGGTIASKADAVYIEIEYTVPSAIKMRNLKGVRL